MMQCVFPIFDFSRADEFLGVSLVNTDSQVREFTVTATAPEGTAPLTGRLSIPAGGQRAELINEILGTPGPPSSGWIRIDSSAVGCTSYLASGNGDMLDGADSPIATSTMVFIPDVSIYTGLAELNFADTYLAIVNPASNPATVAAQLFGVDGAIVGSSSISVPAAGSRTVALSVLFADILPDNRPVGGKVFEGYVRLNSNVPIAAWERIVTPLSRKLLRGRTVEEIRSTTLAVVPHFAVGGIYQSVLNLINPTGAALTLQLSGVDDGGNTLGQSVRMTLSPGQVLRSSVVDLFQIAIPRTLPSPVVSGYIRISGAQGESIQVVGNIEIFTSAIGTRDSSMFYPIGDTAATSWLMPFVSSSTTYFSGYAIANPNGTGVAQTNVTVEVVNSAGTVVDSRAISLSPGGRQAAVVTAPIQSGYLRFTSNLPIYVLGAFGTRDGHILDQLPALR